MRAKEYIERNQSSINYLNDVKRIIGDLMKLRKNKQGTDLYFNQILSTDIRRQNYLLQRDLYEKNNAMQPGEPQLENFNSEISIEKVAAIREILFQSIKDDKSFGYLFFILGTEKNSSHKSEPIDCIPNEKDIFDAINRYRDDYPKELLDDFLDDNLNYEHYDFLVSNEIFPDDNNLLLKYFNDLYRIYDELRCQKINILQLRQYCQQLASSSTKDVFWQLTFISQLINVFESNDNYLKRCNGEIQKILSQLKNQLYPQYLPGTEQNNKDVKSQIFLSSARGKRINFIRVINCLYELGFFKDKQQNEISKKDVFIALGQFLNLDLSTYQNDLSVSKSTANRDMKNSFIIFEDMLDKQKDIMTKN